MFHPTKKWKYIDNFWPSLSFALHKPKLNSEQSRIVRDLNQQGIALTTCDEIFGKGAFESLRSFVDHLEASRLEDIKRARESASDQAGFGVKNFAFFLLGEPTLNLDDLLVKLAIEPALLNIVNSYMNQYAKLWHYEVWHTFVTSGPPKESQLWHFDADDRMIIKCFIYMNDIDSGAGPFTYATRTHSKMGRLPNAETIPGSGGRSNDVQMARLVPESEWVAATGKAGTAVFADTSGYHKGGFCQTSERIMFEVGFTSHAARKPERFKRTSFKPPRNRAQAFALARSHPRFVHPFLEQQRGLAK